MLGVHHATGWRRSAAWLGLVSKASPARAEDACAVRRSALGRAAARAAASLMQPEPRGLLEFFEHRHRRGRRIVPDVRAEALQHHRADRRAARRSARDRVATRSPRPRVAGPVVGDQRHVADLHHEVGRDRRQQVVARADAGERVSATQMRAWVWITQRAGRGVGARRCAVQGEGLAGAVAVDAGAPCGIEPWRAARGRGSRGRHRSA